MLICKRCNQENLDIAKFCKECGSSDLYDPQAQEKLEKERKIQEELKKWEEERKRQIEEERKIAQEEREKRAKERKEFIKKHKKKFILALSSMAVVIFIFFVGFVYDYYYYYGGKYSRVYISKLEKKCREDEASCKILQNIYKEKCDEGDGKACLASMFMSDNLIKVQLNGKWSFIGKNGELITESKFDEAFGFSEGLAAVKINGKYGFIDKNGNFVIEAKFDDVG
ncbi:WG repeat-containing protein, partial [Campylobacter jejuni]|nr:WG repeat-containing protein [Campylobacter jejuni]